MGLALVVVPFLPASNVFFTVGFVVAERVLYLSSIGSCLITVLGFTLLSKERVGKKVSDVFIGQKFPFILQVRLKLRLMNRDRSSFQSNQPNKEASKTNLMGEVVELRVYKVIWKPFVELLIFILYREAYFKCTMLSKNPYKQWFYNAQAS